jgi:hypothetical protein
MGNGVIIIINPRRDFRHPSQWCYRVQAAEKYEFGEVTYGITSIPNFTNFRPAIHLLFQAYKRTSVAKTFD